MSYLPLSPTVTLHAARQRKQYSYGMASQAFFRIPAWLKRSSAHFCTRSFCRQHTFPLSNARRITRSARSYSLFFPLCLVMSGSAATAVFTTGQLRSSQQLDVSSVAEATTGLLFPLLLTLPSQQSSVGSTLPMGTSMHLVGVGSFRLSSSQSAAVGVYRPAPHDSLNQHAAVVVRLSGSTQPVELQRSLQKLIAPAVESATGTGWDNITSCSQLDTALAGLYLPPPSRSSGPPAPPLARRPSSNTALPAGTLLSVELSGRMLRVWLNQRLVCEIDSRMLNAAVLASLFPLCTQKA